VVGREPRRVGEKSCVWVVVGDKKSSSNGRRLNKKERL
jgi:hypothetical protein